jgi:SAM-dependent methyltransferase
MSSFKDHFSGHAADYARFRPTYPDGLFEGIAAASPARERVWDCGCGNGQASLSLARHFARVEASDASAEQIANATPHEAVTYHVAPAEDPAFLADQSVDAVLVAQALHWFDHERFHAALRRVLKPGGLAVAVMYEKATINPDLDRVIEAFYSGAIGPYWPGDRRHINQHYRTVPWPWPRVDIDIPDMVMMWSLDELLGYFGTWSATRRYMADGHADPLPALRAELLSLWGDAAQPRAVRWTLHNLTGRVG